MQGPFSSTKQVPFYFTSMVVDSILVRCSFPEVDDDVSRTRRARATVRVWLLINKVGLGRCLLMVFRHTSLFDSDKSCDDSNMTHRNQP